MSSPVLWYATRATGVVALVLLTVTMVLGILTATRFHAARWPGVAQQELHRRVSILSVLFVAGHVLTAVLDSYVHIGWAAIVVPLASRYRPVWVALGTVSLDLLLAVLGTSLLRHRLPARLWRGVHWLAYASWPVAVLHTVGIGTDVRFHWVLGVVAASVFAVVGAAGLGLIQRRERQRRAELLPAVHRRPAGVPVKHRPDVPSAR